MTEEQRADLWAPAVWSVSSSTHAKAIAYGVNVFHRENRILCPSSNDCKAVVQGEVFRIGSRLWVLAELKKYRIKVNAMIVVEPTIWPRENQ